MKMNMKNRSHRYDINRLRPRHGHKYNKYKNCLFILMLICTIVTQKEIVWIHRSLSLNFRNMLKIAGWSFTQGIDLSKCLQGS